MGRGQKPAATAAHPQGIVHRNHIAPRVHLKHFARNGVLTVWRDGQVNPVSSLKKDACVLIDFYTCTNLTGQVHDQWEHYFEQWENRIGPVFKKISGGQWPLSSDDRTALMNFLIAQTLRGVQFRDVHDEHIKRQAEAALQSLPPGWKQLLALGKMELTVNPAASLEFQERLQASQVEAFSHMRLTLFRFTDDLLLTGDHPAYFWREDTGPSAEGVALADELRFPVTPWLLIVGNWEDGPDNLLQGDQWVAEAANRSTWDSSVRDRCWLPRSSQPPTSTLDRRVISTRHPMPVSNRWCKANDVFQASQNDFLDTRQIKVEFKASIDIPVWVRRV